MRGPALRRPEQTAGGLRGAKPSGLGVRGLPPGLALGVRGLPPGRALGLRGLPPGSAQGPIMRVDVRPVSKLRGQDPVDITTALAPVIDALCAGTADLSRLSVVCDWIQYRSSFREVADYRPVLAAGRPPQPPSQPGPQPG